VQRSREKGLLTVSESGSDGEVGGDGGESLVDLVDIRGLSVEGSVVDRRVVDSILLSTGDSDLHLEPLCKIIARTRRERKKERERSQQKERKKRSVSKRRQSIASQASLQRRQQRWKGRERLTVHLSHSSEVLGAGGDVLLLGLLREIEHVGREERDSVLLEVSLVGVEHTVEPLEELVSTVIGVENDGDTVEGSDGSF